MPETSRRNGISYYKMITEKKAEGKKSFDLATRYLDNARKELALAKKNGKYYEDTKHVSMACGAAYKGTLVALDAILLLRGIEREKKKKASIEFYEYHLAKIDKKILHSLNDVYEILHLAGYYNEFNNAKIILLAFQEAENILKKLKGML